MLNQILKNRVKLFATGGTFLTYLSYYQTMKDVALQEKIDRLQLANSELIQRLNNNKVEELNNEFIKVKVEALKLQLDEVTKSGDRHLEILQKITPSEKEAISNVKYHLDSLTNDTHKGSEILDNIIEALNSKNKFLGDSGDSIKEIINKWNEVLSTLSPTELGALTYLFSSVLILLCLITIMGIVYSDLLLNYFKLEEKYPKLGQYLKIRKMFQQYYLFINFMIIIITLLAIIFLNIQILFFF
jgi:hypothetical protein